MAFKDIVLAEFIKNKQTTVVDDRTSIKEVLSLIAEHQLLAIPVVRAADGSCLGMVTTFDIVNQLITFIHKEGMGRTEEEIDQAALEHLSSPITVCFGLSKETAKAHIFDSLERLEKVLPLFPKGIQRVVVVKKGENPSILSQNDVIKYFCAHFNQPEDLNRSIEELGIFKGPSKVMVLYEDRPAITGFALMAIHRLRVVPVVTLDGKAVTQIGEGDLRGLNPTNLRKIVHPVSNFVKFRHPEGALYPFCKKTSSLREVLGLIMDHGLQRVWVVDEIRRVIGVVTILDIITRFASYERRSGD